MEEFSTLGSQVVHMKPPKSAIFAQPGECLGMFGYICALAFQSKTIEALDMFYGNYNDSLVKTKLETLKFSAFAIL